MGKKYLGIDIEDRFLKLVVMKDGKVAEQGTHEELLAKNGFYTKLYNSQFAQ